MVTATQAAATEAVRNDPWFEPNWAQVPRWLIRSEQLSHSQFHILVALLSVLGGRRGWWHVSYRQLAVMANTDVQTVTKAVNRFIEAEMLITSGSRNWRRYKIDKDAIAAALYTTNNDDDDEED